MFFILLFYVFFFGKNQQRRRKHTKGKLLNNAQENTETEHTQPTLTEGKNEIKCWFQVISLYTHWPISLLQPIVLLLLYVFTSLLLLFAIYTLGFRDEFGKYRCRGILFVKHNICVDREFETHHAVLILNPKSLALTAKVFFTQWNMTVIFIAILCELMYN